MITDIALKKLNDDNPDYTFLRSRRDERDFICVEALKNQVSKLARFLAKELDVDPTYVVWTLEEYMEANNEYR